MITASSLPASSDEYPMNFMGAARDNRAVRKRTQGWGALREIVPKEGGGSQINSVAETNLGNILQTFTRFCDAFSLPIEILLVEAEEAFLVL